MELDQKYLIENELGTLEAETVELEELGSSISEEDQETYDGRLTELEEKIESMRETFTLLRDADEDTWNEVKDAFYKGIDAVRSDLRSIREEFEHRSVAFYDHFN